MWICACRIQLRRLFLLSILRSEPFGSFVLYWTLQKIICHQCTGGAHCSGRAAGLLPISHCLHKHCMLYISQAAALCFGKESPKDCKVWTCSSHCSVELSHAASSFFVWSTSEWGEFARCKRGSRFAQPGDWFALSSHWAGRYKTNVTFGTVCELVKRNLHSARDEICAKEQILALNNASLRYIQDSQQGQLSLYHTTALLDPSGAVWCCCYLLSHLKATQICTNVAPNCTHISALEIWDHYEFPAEKFFAVRDMCRGGKSRNVWACTRVPD